MSDPGTPTAEQLFAAAREARSRGEGDRAASLCQAAVAAAPEDFRPRQLAGVLALEAGDAATAAGHLEAAARMAGNRPAPWHNLGLALGALGQHEDAARAFAVSVESGGGAAALFEQGLALHRAGQLSAAADAYRRTVEAEPAHVDAWVNLGNALRETGDGAGAEAAYRRAVETEPRFALAHFRLADLLAGQGRSTEAVDACRAAVKAEPGLADAWNLMGIHQRLVGDDPAALQAFEHAVDVAPDHVDALANLGELLLDVGRPADAVARYERAVDLAPPDARRQAELAAALMQAGRPQDALARLEAGRALAGDDRTVLAWLPCALAAVGRGDESVALLDYDRLLVEQVLPAPAGWADGKAFRDALWEEVRARPDLEWEPSNRATRHGSQTDDLAGADTPAVAALVGALRTAVDAAIVELRSPGGRRDHPFDAAAPSAWRLVVWATVLGEAGHQRPHIHPDGWLSGVFYAQVPPDIREDDPDRSGWIEFGRPPRDVPPGDDRLVVTRCPREGQAFLFPSYAYHRTLPYAGTGTRVSIAFDVVPE